MCAAFEEPEDEDCPTAIDLFCGAGGLTLGLQLAGIKVVGGWEVRGAERYTYHLHHCEPNHHLSLHGDARDVDPSLVPDDLDVVAGGPVCKDYSNASNGQGIDEERARLVFAPIRWAEETHPKVVLIENVDGLQSSDYYDQMLSELDSAGYVTNTISLTATDYGVPQSRQRTFILGVRKDIGAPAHWKPQKKYRDEQRRLSEFVNSSSTLESYSTAGEALSDLPEPLEYQRPHEDPVHTSMYSFLPYRDESEDKYRVDPHSLAEPVTRDGEEVWIPPNHVAPDHERETQQKMASRPLGWCGDRTTSRRLDPEEPAPTMTDSHGTPPIHYRGPSPPYEDGVPENPSVRRLTPREVAVLQTFPSHITFAGNRREQYRQAANAVPPLLANHLGSHLKERILSPSAGLGSTSSGQMVSA